jgi:hypothetical protein
MKYKEFINDPLGDIKRRDEFLKSKIRFIDEYDKNIIFIEN